MQTGYISILPIYTTKYVGNIAKFVCITNKTVLWTFEIGPVPNSARVSGKVGEVLTIYNVQVEDSGYYRCSIKDNKNIFEEAELVVKSEFQFA